MSALTSDIAVGPFNFSDASAIQEAPLGARAVTGDGREFRYCKAGAVALVPGKLQQAGPEDTAHQNLAPTANVAAGATSFTVTLGASAVTANEYAGGWAVIADATGEGYMYQISSHPAADASGTLALNLADPIIGNLTTASTKVDLVLNPYSAVIVNPAAASSAPIGVAVYAIPAGEYGWIQTKGTTTLLADGAVVVGTAVAASNATAGAVEALTGVQAPIGIAVTGIATTEYGAVNIDL
jgi:hypothetical protein